jgi:adenosylcobyric acid synthase
VVVRFVDHPAALGRPDLIILPGTKMTVADLGFLRAHGLDQAIIALARAGTPVLGICGGYQMLGQAIQDPLGVEATSATTPISGLGLLPVVTIFAARKQTVQMQGVVLADRGLFAGARGLPVQGYEIHMGSTVGAAARVADPPERASLVQIARRGTEASADCDGWITAEGWIAGTYCHGLFDNDALRHILLANLAARKGLARPVGGARWDREAMYDELAAVVRAHVDLAAIYRIVEGG